MLKNGRTYPGNPMQISVALADDAGNPIDPETVTFALMSPCGSKTLLTYGHDGEIARSSAGVYTADIVPDKAGRWNFRWETIGPQFAKEDSFIVLTSLFATDCYRDYV